MYAVYLCAVVGFQLMPVHDVNGGEPCCTARLLAVVLLYQFFRLLFSAFGLDDRDEGGMDMGCFLVHVQHSRNHVFAAVGTFNPFQAVPAPFIQFASLLYLLHVLGASRHNEADDTYLVGADFACQSGTFQPVADGSVWLVPLRWLLFPSVGLLYQLSSGWLPPAFRLFAVVSICSVLATAVGLRSVPDVQVSAVFRANLPECFHTCTVVVEKAVDALIAAQRIESFVHVRYGVQQDVVLYV